MIEAYKQNEAQMMELYNRLSEKPKRQYAAIEALKLGYGGTSYIASLFGCSPKTIRLGIKELNREEEHPERDRKPGGGRKQVLDKNPVINEVFLRLLKEHTAGDPMDEFVKWTNLSCEEIRSLLAEEGIKVSRNIVKKLLKKNGYVKRKALKKKAAGGHENRNGQFERIAQLKEIYTAAGNPVVSVDTKKRK